MVKLLERSQMELEKGSKTKIRKIEEKEEIMDTSNRFELLNQIQENQEKIINRPAAINLKLTSTIVYPVQDPLQDQVLHASPSPTPLTVCFAIGCNFTPTLPHLPCESSSVDSASFPLLPCQASVLTCNGRGRSFGPLLSKCEVCAKIFFEEHAYLSHKDGHKLVIFKCNMCPKEFDSSTTLKRHEESHRPRTCSLCSEVFHDVDTYFNHWIAHENANTPVTPSKQNTCGYCHEEFKTQDELNDHVKVQHKYWCSVCSIDFQTVTSYKKHIDIHTKEGPLEQEKTESIKFTCNICNKEYKTESKFEKHMTVHDPNKPFGCEICGKFFDDENFLKTHQAIHVQKDLQKCDICGKEFKEMLFYNIHRLTHFEQKPIRCDICEDVFTEKIAYIRHRRNHKNREEKEAKRFLTMREMLKQKLEESEKSPEDEGTEAEIILSNINDETGESQSNTSACSSTLDPSKLFHCDFCGKLFEDEQVMKNHRDGHVKKKHQVCDICGDIFTENYLFLRHRNSHRRREDRESKKGKMKRKLEESELSSENVSEDCESNSNENGNIQIKIEKVVSIGIKKKTNFCDLCGKVFDDEDAMKSHRNEHAQNKLIVCDTLFSIDTAIAKMNVKLVKCSNLCLKTERWGMLLPLQQ
ncbi:zinc finger protein 260-like [Argiope bruennichi]|uniref:zinc finger protein 260-like n=1 Tax=Argiope bruennichi TaxID=94029 RepID=UPI0024945FD1|nr:zinc finger protein 260-like [Argiope bruennichi]